MNEWLTSILGGGGGVGVSIDWCINWDEWMTDIHFGGGGWGGLGFPLIGALTEMNEWLTSILVYFSPQCLHLEMKVSWFFFVTFFSVFFLSSFLCHHAMEAACKFRTSEKGLGIFNGVNECIFMLFWQFIPQMSYSSFSVLKSLSWLWRTSQRPSTLRITKFW